MAVTDLSDLSGITTSRRAVVGAALGGLIALGASACGGRGSDESDAADAGSAGATESEGSALAGVSVEVWRDPG